MVNTQLLTEKSVQHKKRARLLSAENVIRLGRFTSQMYVCNMHSVYAIVLYWPFLLELSYCESCPLLNFNILSNFWYKLSQLLDLSRLCNSLESLYVYNMA